MGGLLHWDKMGTIAMLAKATGQVVQTSGRGGIEFPADTRPNSSRHRNRDPMAAQPVVEGNTIAPSLGAVRRDGADGGTATRLLAINRGEPLTAP